MLAALAACVEGKPYYNGSSSTVAAMRAGPGHKRVNRTHLALPHELPRTRGRIPARGATVPPEAPWVAASRTGPARGRECERDSASGDKGVAKATNVLPPTFTAFVHITPTASCSVMCRANATSPNQKSKGSPAKKKVCVPSKVIPLAKTKSSTGVRHRCCPRAMCGLSQRTACRRIARMSARNS